MNNNTEWFNENRDRYDKLVKVPMKQFSNDVAERLNSMGMDENFVPSISRANRDIRFSKDKSPYKDKKWVVFNYGEGRWQDKICFYFEIAPEGWCCGCGTYSADSNFMTRYRRKLSADTSAVNRIEEMISQQEYFSMDTTLYKKNFTPEGTDDKIAKWYQYRNVAVISDYQLDESLFSADIIDIVSEKYRFLKEFFMHFKDI